MEKVNVIKSKFLRGIFDQNTYVICDDDSAVIIDAGAELENIMEVVQNREVLAVLMTHLHFDHIWNLRQILDKYKCPVFIVNGSEEKFADIEKNVSKSMRQKISVQVNKQEIKYYEKYLKLKDFNFEIIKTPGHSADSVCILLDKYMFSGDTVFENAIGRTDLYDSSETEMINSLQTLKNVDCEIVYPGHYGSATKQQVNQIISEYC